MFKGVMFFENNLNLLYALAASPRFRDIKMTYYVNKLDYKQEKQFSAVTYQIDDRTSYISYRGTDMTFVGWKEDFNMAFQSPVPSQEEGTEYLNTVGGLLEGDLIVGGHSKGGNIAVYSAMKCDPAIQSRILDVYSHDGPGFKDSIFHSPEYLRIKDRIHKILPQSSIVGMLLQTQESYRVIKSRKSGIMQHDPFTWVIEDDDFHYVKNISNSSLNMNKTINEWLSNISDEKRELFIDALFQTINSTNAKSIGDLSEVQIKDFAKILKAFRSIDNETRKFLSQTIRDLILLYVRNLNPMKN
jgi:intein/homing endonuclease